MSQHSVAASALVDVLKDSGDSNDELVRQTESFVARSRSVLPLPAGAEPARAHLCAIAACRAAGVGSEVLRVPLPPKKRTRLAAAFCETLVPVSAGRRLQKDAAALCTRAGRAQAAAHLVRAVEFLRKLHPRADSYPGLLYTAALFVFAKTGKHSVNSRALRGELFAAIGDAAFDKAALDRWIALLRDEIEHSAWYSEMEMGHSAQCSESTPRVLRKDKMSAATGALACFGISALTARHRWTI
ncbi:Origin recognition complex subunit 6 [Neolecta irregularis DAH-3]|uniref:Origin recognition complex subunit 6 n=1 Tax=Neolecta irregularis (strain DAH-3) TaxID=1198029 RepID=A0A1U7LWN0_NEOID|nr:Origin recognition complex subunit 6 [Neolecta irregularis DAH-3]|eukprot:OLL27077.1 Origin recognition complex subunit 6 [Neolecta irregularis DAH-3]